MFVNFFLELRQAKVPVSIKEYLALMEGMDKRVSDFSVDDFYYRRRHLAKVEHAEAHGWHDVKYQHAMMDLADAIEKELRIVAKDLIKVIESDVEYHGDARRDQTSYVKV